MSVESDVATLLAGQTHAENNATAHRNDVLSAISSLQQDVQRIASSPVLMSRDVLKLVATTALKQTMLPISETEIVDWSTDPEVLIQLLQNTTGHRDRVDKRASKGLKTFAGVSAEQVCYGQRCQRVSMGKRQIRRRIRRFWKRFAVPFGHPLFCYNTETRGWSSGSLDCHIQTSEFQLTFLPRPLLLRQAISITATNGSLSKSSLGSLNLQLRPIVADDSPIFHACRFGDINTMKFLFKRGDASPHDLNENGEDLILVSAEWWLHFFFNLSHSFPRRL